MITRQVTCVEIKRIDTISLKDVRASFNDVGKDTGLVLDVERGDAKLFVVGGTYELTVKEVTE